jgi:fatty-acyl-CoA synthase
MKLSQDQGPSSPPLIEKTIGDFLDEIAGRHPDCDALVSVFEKKRYTYKEFVAEVDRYARALMALGVKKGDRVGIWSTNCAAWTLFQFATAKMGAILVCVNPSYRTHELQFTLKQSECNVLVIGEGFKDADYAAMVIELVPELKAGKPEVDLKSKSFPHLRRVVTLSERKDLPMLTLAVFVALGEKMPATELAGRQASLKADEVINIQYTSGTTGFPKGAMLTHRGILNNGFGVGERMRLTHKDRLCIPVPFYHCFGMVLGNLACVTHGAAMILPAPHFSPLATLQAVAAEKCTALHGVPTMFVAELNHPDFKSFDCSTLRTGIMAGAPCPVEVMKRVIEEMHCKDITIACGMTETSPVCNQTEHDDPIELRVGSVGKTMPHQEQKIIDPNTGIVLPRGEQGELCYRGYHIMQGYYNNPEATQETIDKDGWLHSGDLAVMDEQGYVKITGRLKDMICRGGEKIFPREVEEFLFTHPKIAEAYVIGVPDAYYGEEVMVWVKLKDPQTMSAEEVRAFCKGRIMDYKIPRHIKFVTEFPTTVTGKVQKYKMREISSRELGLEPKAKSAA